MQNVAQRKVSALAALAEMSVDDFAALVAAKLREPANDIAGAYYDSRSAPCGARAFLDGARAGAFPSFQRGRRVLARVADVQGWIEARPRAVKAPAVDLDDAALLEAAGIRRRSPR